MSLIRRTIRKLKKELDTEQWIALCSAIPFGKLDNQRKPKPFELPDENDKRRKWCRRLEFDFNGGREMIGPVWHVEIWITENEIVEGPNARAVLDIPINVFRWSIADQNRGKLWALSTLANVGTGEQIDVFVDDTTLHVYKRASAEETAVAEIGGK